MTNHTVNKDLSQKLADAGVDVESEFYWANIGRGWVVENKERIFQLPVEDADEFMDAGDLFPAYLLSELKQMVNSNDYIVLWNGDTFIGHQKIDQGIDTELTTDEESHSRVTSMWKKYEVMSSQNIMDVTEVDTYAHLVLWLIEQGHVNPKEL